ncbi:hypothetical protein [Bradyrhizobium lablabi]|nr:hypothetical protein [Bradyrhizobium lablabi]
MSAQEIWKNGSRRFASGDAVLRHPNGSIDIGAYAAIAHRERAAALMSSLWSAVRPIRDVWAAIAVRRAHQRTAAGKPCG